MYGEAGHRPKQPLAKILLVTVLVVLLLCVVRFLNLVMWWNVTRLELSTTQLTRVENYHFLGLSSYEKAEKKCQYFSQVRPTGETIVSYFDPVHPVVFLVDKGDQRGFVNLGLMTVYPGPGLTAFIFYPADIVESKRKNSPGKAVYFGNSLFPGLFQTLAKYIAGSGGRDQPPGSGISYIINPLEDSKYLKVPYMVYFYLPMVLIFILGVHYGGAFYISFFYYLGLFLLFDFRKVLFIIPFSWLIKLLGIEVSPLAAFITAALVLTLFAVLAFVGISYYRRLAPAERRLGLWSKGLIFFFLLCPLFLRF